ncbi:YadA family autotransporter adhesin [Burkholderia pyrrocinia]|uniref:YadA family autotransporter adhesin n=1 Tax=Burkholderia pyrrocinia TaxID=60550 RepID=UPI00158BBCCD|nr:YadA-like family protein [Burkholderia pyrrocinia]
MSSLSTGVSSLSTGLSTTNSTVSSLSTSTSSAVSSLSTAITRSSPHYLSFNDDGIQQANYNNDGATGSGSVALGPAASASGRNSTAIGDRAGAVADGATALGANSKASGTNATAMGMSATASAPSAAALGANATASAPNAVALGTGAIANEANTVSIGSPNNERRITNVAPGINPTDAVNVSQLRGVQEGINTVARKAYAGVAAATALSMIPEVDLGKAVSIGIGAANYQGAAALAVGFTARLTNNVKVRGGVGVTSAGYTVGAGVSYQW